MKNLIFTIKLFIGILLLVACGGGDSGGDGGTTTTNTGGNTNSGNPTTETPTPKAVSLVFPEHNTECNEGSNETETTSDVNFQWNMAEDTDSYEIHVVNLNNDEELVQTTSNDNIDLTIMRATPYSWHVISKANGTNATATSSIFNFYNAGAAIDNHAPFPASVVAPDMGASIEMDNLNLVWEASDIDGDIVGFEVYFDTINPPENKIAETSESSIAVTTETSTIYYWRIITSDSNGNTSRSAVFEFRTN
ncbi:MAG: hypothetical protein KJO73_04785 [Croceitalea sp.]|nr:hypothetical protein [Croceitalea sp.]